MPFLLHNVKVKLDLSSRYWHHLTFGNRNPRHQNSTVRSGRNELFPFEGLLDHSGKNCGLTPRK